MGTATVDRVLNRRPGVNAETVQRVLQVVATLGAPPSVYYPRIPRAEEVMTKSPAAVEMPLLWKSQTDFHRSLEISHRTRDSHIPTSRFLFRFKEKNVE